jgi:rare lipoprotein A
VKINDRGPFVENRLIDLSYAAASKLGMLGTGTALVDVVAVGPGDLGPPPATVAPVPAVDVAALPPAAGTATGPQALVTAGGPPLIYLQVGAYVERGNAEGVTQKLAAAGVEHAFILSMADGQRTLYKVRVGPVPDVDAVDTLGSKLAKLGYPDVQIVIP